MATQDSTQIELLGPAKVSLGGSSLGYVEDVTLEMEFTDVDAKVAKYGDTPLKSWHLSTKARVKFPLHQIDYPTYEKLIQGSKHITDGSDSAIGFGSSAGLALTGLELIIEPEQSTRLGDIGKLILWKVVPRDGRGISWNKETQKLEVTLEAQVNESKGEGEKLGRFGNATVAADSTAPTVSSASPADGATGVSVSAEKTITFNEAMDADTINTQNLLLFVAAETGTPAPVAITTRVISSTQIGYTPVSALSASTEYELILTTNIKNVSGIRFAGAKYSFTTA